MKSKDLNSTCRIPPPPATPYPPLIPAPGNNTYSFCGPSGLQVSNFVLHTSLTRHKHTVTHVHIDSQQECGECGRGGRPEEAHYA